MNRLERLKDEQISLTAKIKRLETFLERYENGEIDSHVIPQEIKLLYLQLDSMRRYRNILSERIEIVEREELNGTCKQDKNF